MSQYGGDPSQIHVLAHGSGAHLALLTTVQDAVIASRDGFRVEKERDMHDGIKQLRVWGSNGELPKLRSLILFANLLHHSVMFLGCTV
jgi:hypothetical protein